MTSEPVTSEERGYSFERVGMFSDGVFAIAATLLVLDVRVPPTTHVAHLAHAVSEIRTELFAYALSFVVIAVFWLAHHRLYDALRTIDHRLLIANLVLLGIVAAIPFPTDLIGRYAESGVAVATYAAVLGAAGLVATYTWWYARRAQLFRPDVSDVTVVHSMWRGVSLAAVFLASIPLALVSPDAAKLAWLAIIVFRLILTRRFGPIYRPA